MNRGVLIFLALILLVACYGNSSIASVRTNRLNQKEQRLLDHCVVGWRSGPRQLLKPMDEMKQYYASIGQPSRFYSLADNLFTNHDAGCIAYEWWKRDLTPTLVLFSELAHENGDEKLADIALRKGGYCWQSEQLDQPEQVVIFWEKKKILSEPNYLADSNARAFLKVWSDITPEEFSARLASTISPDRVYGLDVSNIKIGMEGFELICHKLPNLEELVIDTTGINYNQLSSIKNIKSLRKLTIKGFFSKTDLQAIAALDGLQELNINLIHTRKESLPFLSGHWKTLALELDDGSLLGCLGFCPELKTLTISNTDFKAIKANDLDWCPNISRLCFGQKNNVRIESLCALSELKRLKSIDFSGLKMTPNDLEKLSCFSGAIQLDLGEFDQQWLNAPSATFPRLKELRFPLFSADNKTIDSLKKIQGLEEIFLGEGASDEAISKLKELGSLKRVEIHSSFLTDDSMEKLSWAERLESISFSGAQITNKGLKKLANLHQLIELRINKTHPIPAYRISGNAFSQGFKNLRRLELNWCAIDNAGLAALSNLRGLEELQIKYPLTASNDNFNLNGTSLSKLEKLQRLELVGVPINDSTLRVLLKLKSLKHLDVRATKLSYSALAKLEEELPACKITPSLKQVRETLELFPINVEVAHPIDPRQSQLEFPSSLKLK